MVKIVKQEHEVSNIQPLSSVKHFSFDFIELFDFSLGDNLTPHSLSMISLNLISQVGSLQPQFPLSPLFSNLSSQPSSSFGSIQLVVSCLHLIALLGQSSNELRNLDYDKILVQKVHSYQLFLMGMSCLNCLF